MKKSNFKYFSEAQHLANGRFLGIDGFDNFASNYRRADGGTNGAVQNFDVSTSSPYEFTVANANTSSTSVTLFNSYAARTASGNGAPSGITFAAVAANVTYTQILAQTESKNFECGMTYIEIVTGSNAGLTATWSLTTGDASGNFQTVVKTPKINPMQNILTSLTFENTFRIDGFTSIVLTIPASTTIKYSFYPSATAALGRVLSTGNIVRDYSAPMITPPQQIQMSPSAMAMFNQS